MAIREAFFEIVFSPPAHPDGQWAKIRACKNNSDEALTMWELIAKQQPENWNPEELSYTLSNPEDLDSMVRVFHNVYLESFISVR